MGITYRRIRQVSPLSSNLILKAGQFLQGIDYLNVLAVLGFTIQTGHRDFIIQCFRITESLNHTLTTQHLSEQVKGLGVSPELYVIGCFQSILLLLGQPVTLLIGSLLGRYSVDVPYTLRFYQSGTGTQITS